MFEVENDLLTQEEVIEKAKTLARSKGYGKFIILIDDEEYYDASDLPEEVDADAVIDVKAYVKAGFTA